MIFLSTETFRKAIRQLLKAKRDEYASINKDIADAFLDKTSDQIYVMPDMVRQSGNIKEIKLRLENSRSGLGKSAGYRLLYLTSDRKNFVCFLYVYPKRGSLGQVSISKECINGCLSEFIAEYESKTLICHDIYDLSHNKKSKCKKEECEHEQLSCIEE